MGPPTIRYPVAFYLDVLFAAACQSPRPVTLRSYCHSNDHTHVSTRAAVTWVHVDRVKCIAATRRQRSFAARMADAMDFEVPALDDDLLKDRTRSFTEFLDDQARGGS